MQTPAVSAFGEILLYLIAGIVFVGGALLTAWIIRPHRPNPEKLATYESGEAAVGNAWGQFNIRFYIVALIFILFDVELVFLFPWATVFADKSLILASEGLWGWFVFAEMLVFVLILALGLAWAWAKGMLDWVRPEQQPGNIDSPVPAALYKQFNKQIENMSRKPQQDQH